MNFYKYEHCHQFLNDVEPFLLNDLYMNNLMLGLLYRIKDKPSNPNDLFLRITNQDQEIVVMMSGLYIIMYANTTDHHTYIKLINYLEDNQIDYPGVIGPNLYCEAFAKAYEEKYSKPMQLGMSQRIFVNQHVNDISKIDAEMIQIKDENLPLLVDWMYDFLLVTLEKPTPEYAKERLDAIIEAKGLYVLKHDNQIVSMAGAIRPFRGGVSVGYVYTPPQFRNKGYATKLVALLTDKLLKTYDFCTLYTDLANPTSNSIYQKIGYKKVGDSVVYIKT